MWERFVNWWERQDDILTLEGMSDRMLEDMGLARRDLRRRLRGEPGAEAAGRDGGGPWGVPAVW